MASSSLTLATAILEIGTQGIPEAHQQLGSLQQDLATLQRAYNAGTISMDEYLKESAALKSQINNLTDAINVAEKAVSKYGSVQSASNELNKKLQESMKGVRQSFGDTAMTLMAFSNVVDDIQYGFHSIVNNLPMLIGGIGRLAGLSPQTALVAGAIAQIGGVIISNALPRIQELAREIGLLGDSGGEAMLGIEKLEARIKELKEKPVKLAVDMYELDQAEERVKELKENMKAFEHFRDMKSSHQKEAGQQIGKVIAETGKADQITDAIKAEIYKEKLQSLKGGIGTEIWNLEQEAAKNRYFSKHGGGKYDWFRHEKIAIELEKKANELKEKHGRAGYKAQEEAEADLGEITKGALAGNDPNARERLVKRLVQINGKVKDLNTRELAQKVWEITPETVKTKADKKKADDALHEQDQKERQRISEIRYALAAEHQDKGSMEPMARDVLAMRKAGMNDADIFRKYQDLLRNELVSRMTPEEQKSQNMQKLTMSEATSLARQVNTLANQLGKVEEQQAKAQATIDKQTAKHGIKETLDDLVLAERAEQQAMESLKAKHAKGIPDLQAMGMTTEELTKGFTEQLAGQGIRGELAQAAAHDKAADVTRAAQRSLLRAKDALERKDIAKDEREDKRLDELSGESLGMYNMAEQIIAYLNAESLQRRQNGQRGYSQQEIKDYVQRWLRDRLHHRYIGENENAVPIMDEQNPNVIKDFNPRMKEEETKQKASDIYDKANLNFSEHLARANGAGLNNINRLTRIAFDLNQELALQQQQVQLQSQQIGILEHAVRSNKRSGQKRGH